MAFASGTLMSITGVPADDSETASETLVTLTDRAFRLAISATQNAADLVLGAKSALQPIIACEREVDHVKNTAEEVCHLVSGYTVRHLLGLHAKSAEQLYLEHLRRQHLPDRSSGK